MEMIEAADTSFFGPLLEIVEMNDIVMTITADHSTSCLIKAHSSHPVPLAIVGGGVDRDDVDRFSEAGCEGGSIGVIKGEELMPILVDLAT